MKRASEVLLLSLLLGVSVAGSARGQPREENQPQPGYEPTMRSSYSQSVPVPGQPSAAAPSAPGQGPQAGEPAQASTARAHQQAGSFALAGDAYLEAFRVSGNPLYLKQAGLAYVRLNDERGADAWRAFKSFELNARDAAEADEARSLLAMVARYEQEANTYVLPSYQAPTAPPPVSQPSLPSPYVPQPYGPAGYAPPVAPPQAPPPSRFSEERGVSLGVERMAQLGYYASESSVADPTGLRYESERSGGGLSVLGSGGDITMIPRFAVDALLGSGVTLGAAAAMSIFGYTDEAGGTTQRELSRALFTFEPRVGYRMALGGNFDLWPTAGFGIAASAIGLRDGSGIVQAEESALEVYLNIAGSFVWNMRSHVGLTFGAYLDKSLTGDADIQSGTTSSSADTSGMGAGVTAGLLGWL